MDVDNQLRTYKILSRLDNVDIVLPGRGPVLKQDSFMETYRIYSALRERVLQYMIEGKPLSEIRQLVKMDDFKDYAGVATVLDENIVTMYQFLYRYREPNSRLTGPEAVSCIENVKNCRTSDPPK